MTSLKSYFAFLVFFIMASSRLVAQQVTSDSIMEIYNCVVMNDSNQIGAYGNLKQNIPHGDWIYFSYAGKKKSTGKFKKGKKHGKWLFYDVFGDKITTGRYKKGMMHGKWVFHYLKNECVAKYKENLKVSTTCPYEY